MKPSEKIENRISNLDLQDHDSYTCHVVSQFMGWLMSDYYFENFIPDDVKFRGIIDCDNSVAEIRAKSIKDFTNFLKGFGL